MTKNSYKKKKEGLKLPQIQFLYGSKLQEVNPAIKPGTIYLDIATGELYYDDPTPNSNIRQKIIDIATLIYTVDQNNGTITFPSSGSEDESIPGFGNGGDNAGGATTATLGVAILGTMILGTS